MNLTLSKRTLASCLFFYCSAAYAEQQAAHVHGLATLTLALEGNTLEIQLESPSANLVGFEHVAKSEQEKARIHKTKSLLDDPQNLFSFDGSSCKIQNIDIDITAVLVDTHAEDDHGHHDEDKDHHEDEHHDHTDHKDGHEDSHSEIDAHYQFTCDKAEQLKSISIELFKQFPGIEKIDAMWVTKSLQGSSVLFASNKTIRLN